MSFNNALGYADDTFLNLSRRGGFLRHAIPAALRNAAVLLVLAANPSAASAQACAGIVGAETTPDRAMGVAVRGNHAYVADGGCGLSPGLYCGLYVYDISDPTNPIRLPTQPDWATADAAREVVFYGNYAYVPIEESGIAVFDVSNPADPVQLSSVAVGPGGRAIDAVVSGIRLFVADQFIGLEVFDLRNPAVPSLAATVEIPGQAVSVDIVGRFAYVTQNHPSSALHAISINPLSPSYDTLPLAGNARHVDAKGNFAYIANRTVGLQIIDISDPTNLQPVAGGVLATPSNATAIRKAGNAAYIADDFSGLQIIDVTNPEAPGTLTSVNTPGAAIGVTISGGFAYIADRQGGLQVVEICGCVPLSAGVISETKLTASDGARADQFGYSVAMSGDTAIVGTRDFDPGVAYGSAYIYQDTSAARDWSSFTETRLVPSDGLAFTFFGNSVAISGDTAIVGAWGAAYIYQDTSTAGDWSSIAETKLVASDGEIEDLFGFGGFPSVGISGNVAIVGARGNDDVGDRSGSAYIYQDTSAAGDWSSFTETKLVASDGAENAQFGSSSVIDGDTAIVSTIHGRVYIYQDTSAAGDWSSFTETKVGASAGAGRFGSSLAMGDDIVIIGSSSLGFHVLQDTSATGDWSSITVTLLRPSGGVPPRFGLSVAISDGRVIVGAEGYDAVGLYSGAAYIYQDTSAAGDWSSFTETKLVPCDAAEFDSFGRSVAISGQTLFVGARLDDDVGYHSGSVYVYQFAPLNTPPVADAGPDQVVECTGGVASVTLDGMHSFDPDGSIADYEWREGATVLAAGVSPAATVVLPLGAHAITLTVTDSEGVTDSADVLVEVVDTTPPDLEASLPLLIEHEGDKAHGETDEGEFVVSYTTSDVCCLDSVEAFLRVDGYGETIAVTQGQIVKIKEKPEAEKAKVKVKTKVKHGVEETKIKIKAAHTELVVRAIDCQGNTSEVVALPEFPTDGDAHSDDSSDVEDHG